MKKLKSVMALSLFLNYFTPFTVLASEMDVVPSEEVSVMEEIKSEQKELLLQSLKNQELKVSASEFLLGEQMEFEWKISKEVGIDSVKLTLINETEEVIIPLSWSEETNSFVGSFTLEDNPLHVGDWQVKFISVDSKEGETFQISNKEEGVNISSIKISEPSSLPTPVPPSETAPELVGVKDLTFTLGDDIDLRANVTANDEIDADISEDIQVDSSELDSSTRGTYDVVYSVTNSAGKTTEIKATVTIIDPKVVTFEITDTTKTLSEGQTHKIETEVTTQDDPEYTIEWTSNDEKVMTVDKEGNVTAVSPGTATITAKTGTLSATIEITVEKKESSLQGITLNKKDFSLQLGKKEQLTVTYNPTNTTDDKKVTWSSNAPKVVSIDAKGNIEALSAGAASITAKVGIHTATVEVTVPVGTATISYSTHVEKIGWQKNVKDGEVAGTEGQYKRLEGIKVSLKDLPYSGGVEYQTHVQSYGWMNKVNNGAVSGTEGQAKRLEAIRLNLSGEMAKHYDIYYQVHAQSFGWLDWAKNGEEAGTAGLAKRLEGIKIVLVKKGEPAPGDTQRSYVISKPTVNYSTHVQKYGWQRVVSNGQMSGTSGKALRLEGILMNIHDPSLSGGIQYRTHIEKIGWQDWKADWNMSGTQGQALRLEAIEIKLTEEMAKHYDVYYRVHAESYGWLGWAKNGESAGTAGLAKRLEGIEVRLVLKSNNAPGNTTNSFVTK